MNIAVDIHDVDLIALVINGQESLGKVTDMMTYHCQDKLVKFEEQALWLGVSQIHVEGSSRFWVSNLATNVRCVQRIRRNKRFQS